MTLALAQLVILLSRIGQRLVNNSDVFKNLRPALSFQNVLSKICLFLGLAHARMRHLRLRSVMESFHPFGENFSDASL